MFRFAVRELVNVLLNTELYLHRDLHCIQGNDVHVYAFIYLLMHLYIRGTHFIQRDSHCIQCIYLYMHLFMYNECKNSVHCLIY